MKNANLAALVAAPLMIFALSLPALADSATPTNCKDGTTSTATGKGACSGHGGVQKAAASAPAAAAPAAPATPAAAPPVAAGATATCKDGTTSTATGKGACSGHGGVQKAAKTKPAADTTAAAPAATPAPAAAPAPGTAMMAAPAAAKTSTAGTTDPTGATAKCKDGTYSKSTHKAGTCSSHGGVAQWMTAAQ
jgi:Protein of unknown function (DUF3761)